MQNALELSSKGSLDAVSRAELVGTIRAVYASCCRERVLAADFAKSSTECENDGVKSTWRIACTHFHSCRAELCSQGFGHVGRL